MEASLRTNGYFGRFVSMLVLVVAAVLCGTHSARGDYCNSAAEIDSFHAARAAIDAECDCAGAATPGTYRRCASTVMNQRVKDGLLSPQCKRLVKQCVSKSTCGRPGFVTCCRLRNFFSECTVRDAAKCAALGGTAATCPSCCDACPAPGDCTTTTTAPAP
jgi:hypothetical protein